jgi:hypothetical protein
MKISSLFPSWSATLAAVFFAVISAAHAQLFYGVGGLGDTNGNPTAPSLFTFNAATPGTVATIGAITGVGSSQTVEGIAVAPNGTLYLLGYVASGGNLGNSQLYTVNTTTGAATPVNATPTNIGFSQGGASSVSFGLAFVGANTIQVIDGGGNIYQLNSSTGGIVAGSVSSVTYSSSPVAGNVEQWAGLALGTNGRLYTIDETNNQLGVRQTADPTKIDPIGNSPASPGPLGISTRGPATMGVDISAAGIAYLQTDTDDAGVADDLYRVNLTTGAATLVGQIGSNSNFNTIDIAATVPEPGTSAMIAAGALLVARVVFRRRRHP